MSNKAKYWTVFGILGLVLGYYMASPYIVLYQIKQAIQAKDAEKVSRYIDYPSVRQSVKDQMNAMMMQEMSQMSNRNTGGFEQLGALFATTMVDKMVDGYVTPHGLEKALAGKDMTPMGNDSVSNQGEQTDTHPNDFSNFGENVKTETDYTAMNEFQVSFYGKDPNDTEPPLEFKMKRDGLSWRVIEVKLPLPEH